LENSETKNFVKTTWCEIGGGFENELEEYGMSIVDDVRVWTFSSTADAYDMTQCDDDLKTGDVLLIPSEKVVGVADVYPMAVTKHTGHLHGVKEGFKIEDLFVCDISADYMNKALKVARGLATSYEGE